MRIVLLLTMLTACWTTTAASKPIASNAALQPTTARVGPIQVGSLTLTPIIGSPATAPDFIVLDEGMATDVVTITEVPNETVNELAIVNHSDRDLFLLAGEVIIGGKQDRIIGRNTVIPAHTNQSVPVFCVEHGRWDSTGDGFRSANALAHGRLRGQASYATQQDVWDEVSVTNAIHATRSDTDTYRIVAFEQSGATFAAQREKIAAALKQLPASTRAKMVGYAVAINGSVATVDVFSSPALFRKLETKLLNSYITEASRIAPEVNARPPTWQDVQTFMSDADDERQQSSYSTSNSTTSVQNGSSTNSSSVWVGTENVYRNYQAR